MEQHPVPQNVTTFQFRLIGDMTLKQFGYLCAGAILAFVAYKLPLPFIITWPLAFSFAFLGVGFAFIPVEERPMDVWVFSFFKSIYNPTQYIWTKEPPKPIPAAPNSAVPPAPTKTVLSKLFQAPQAPPPQKLHASVVTTHPAPSVLTWLTDLWNPTPSSVPPQPQAIATQPPTLTRVTGYRPPSPAPATPAAALTPSPEETWGAQQKMTQLEVSLKLLQEQLATKNITADRVLELQKQLTEVLQQKSTMENELVDLKRQLASHEAPKTPRAPSTPKSVVTVINTQDAATKVGLPRLTNIANVITGLAKDDAGNFLPGILVTVTNGEGIPVRALKTNKLGQFAASTPLASGTYYVEIEDPRNRFTFSRVQITLTGAVVPAIEIIAKSQKQLSREKIAQEIFGKNSM